MEKLKLLPDVLQPDERNLQFVNIDTWQPSTLADHHAEIAAVVLNPSVPENVRSYFATIQNTFLYGWFAYDLYAVGCFLCSTAIEMALRKRLPWAGQEKDIRALGNLLDQANTQKLIKEKGFSHRRELRKNIADRLRADRRITGIRGSSGLPKGDYAKDLSERVRKLRNYFAHPRDHSILMPGDALFQFHMTADLINQLWL